MSSLRGGRRGVALTTDGEALLIYARTMIALTDDLRRQLDGSGGKTFISIGMVDDFCRTALPWVLRLFMSDHPEVEIRILTGPYSELKEALQSGSIDFAVMRRYPGAEGAETFWTDQLVWVGRSGLVGPIADPVPLALPVGPNPGRDTVINVLQAAGRTWRVVFEGQSLVGVEAARQAGIGIFVAPRCMFLHDVEPLSPDSGLPLLPEVEFVLMLRTGKELGGAELAFIEIIRRAAASSFR